MARGGARKAGGPSKKGAKAAVKILTPVDATPSDIPPLPEYHDYFIPLPGREDPADGEWFKAVQDWWDSIWLSPMTREWLASDIHTLYQAAALLQESLNPFYKLGDRIKAQKAHQEILKMYGLTPLAREQLRWSVAQGEAAATRTNQLRAAAPKTVSAKVVRDEMQALYSRHTGTIDAEVLG